MLVDDQSLQKSLAYHQKETSQSPSHNKTGIIGNHGSTIRAHRNPNYSFIQLGAKSNKMCTRCMRVFCLTIDSVLRIVDGSICVTNQLKTITGLEVINF